MAFAAASRNSSTCVAAQPARSKTRLTQTKATAATTPPHPPNEITTAFFDRQVSGSDGSDRAIVAKYAAVTVAKHVTAGVDNPKSTKLCSAIAARPTKAPNASRP